MNVKIIELYIYGYGQLENLHINQLSDFQVFYGENEAGKSTIMAFIHGILFGFPTKQQSSELRYEPKHNSKYGGKIRIYHEKHGFAVIERIKGKSTGDVQVTLDNGTVGGEELLKELLANFDKNLFQAIFSFNLHGLQNIHQMRGEEIGKFLFSAGTLGTERLSQTEAFLQKELDSRFKPSGKKPVINEKLQALHEINNDLKKAAAKNEEYQTLMERKQRIQQEIAEINKGLLEIQEKIEKLNEWKRIEDFVKEEIWAKNEVAEIGEIQFPARGIERIEQLKQLLYPYRAQITSISERIEKLKNEIVAIQPNQSLLENESEMVTFLDQLPLHEQLKLEKQQCEAKRLDLEEKLAVFNERLHLPLSEDDILSINTNIYMKNEVEVVSLKGKKLEERKQELEASFQEEKTALELLEKDVRLAKEHVLPDLQREKLVEQLNNGDQKSIENELTTITEKIDFYQQANEQTKRSRQQKKLQLFTFELFLLGFALYGVITKQWFLIFLGLAGGFLLGIFMTRNKSQSNQKDTHQVLQQLKEREKLLNEKLQSATYVNFTVLKEKLTLDNQRKEQLQVVKLKLEQQQFQYEKVISKFEAWEADAASHKEKVFTMANQLKVPEYIAATHLSEAFQLIEQYKVAGREKRKIQERLEQIEQEQKRIENGLMVFAKRYLPENHLDLYKTSYLLRNILKEEHEKKIISQEKLAKLADFQADLQQKVREQEQVQVELNRLLTEAQTSNEQQFYEKGAMAEKLTKQKERLADIQKQLQFTNLTEPEQKSFLQIQNGEEMMENCHNQAIILQEKLKMLQEEQASIKYEIQVLEEGGVYSEILHRFKQKKFEVEEAAKEWSVYCIAQDILLKTVEKYKNIHLPRMLAKAEEYLFFLTDEKYHKIHLQKSGTGFLIEKTDYTIFEANELSQATMEQVYVSIRLALATTLYEKYCLPIIIDDSFVNFDANRTQKVIELLKGLTSNQILFFTCHHHLLENFAEKEILFLNKGAVQIHS